VRAGRESERQGRQEEARGYFERALRSVEGSERTALAPSIFRWIAWTHAKMGDSEAALDCLAVAEATSEATGDDRGLASALNTRAGTLFNLGELDEAEALFRQVRTLAPRIGDRKLQAMSEQNLGSVACIRGDLRLALGRFRSSLEIYESMGLSEYVGPLLNNIGRLQIDLGENTEAAGTLARARALCLERGDQHHQIVVEVNRARLLLRSGETRRALEAGEEARQLALTTGDDRWLADIHLVMGSSYGRLEQPDVALGFLDRAAEIARSRCDAKILADIVLEQAGVFRELGRNRETLKRLNEAHRIFLRLRASRDLADVDSRLANLEEVFLQITKSWGESIESKDAYTQGHCSRVADGACLLATAHGLPEDEMTWFRMGALLHDVGKVEVPLSILNKPGPLDADEMLVMARHPVAGVELLDGVEFPWDVRPMIRHHHERWDGTGYPDRIAGAEIPLAARILMIADIYDALTTDRSYRPGFSHVKALGIMKAEAGKTVDPTLLPLFAERVAPKLSRQKGSRREEPVVFAAALAT
jgi:putative nucleotidyltransferase with HDIG domain